jgi:hypothetical protein
VLSALHCKQKKEVVMKALSLLIELFTPTTAILWFGVLAVIVVLLFCLVFTRAGVPESNAARLRRREKEVRKEAQQKVRLAQNLRCSLIDCILDQSGTNSSIAMANTFEARASTLLTEAVRALREKRYADAIQDALEASGFLQRGMDELFN